uniref:Uncharacterized protein n=1 Tax=Arundo donax TaxID=35708 RepID=A0A0A8Y0U9_ARUDO
MQLSTQFGHRQVDSAVALLNSSISHSIHRRPPFAGSIPSPRGHWSGGATADWRRSEGLPQERRNRGCCHQEI